VSERLAVILTNYNMPERADALGDHLAAYCRQPYDFYCVDNGSDLAAPARYTNVHLPTNRQTTGGWAAGLEMARENGPYLGYVFVITSTEFVGPSDPLAPLAARLLDDPNAVGAHPALTADSTTHWEHLKTRGTGGARRTWMIDNICAAYRAEWFDAMGGFDPRLPYAWGVDLETGWKARRDGRSLWVCEDVPVKKVTNIGYTMHRMRMSADERGRKAYDNMAAVLSGRYGGNWWGRMTEEYVDGTMR
jgi:GT2 family glycosyltransferase